MVLATTHLIGFSGETIWPLGQIALLVKIGDEVHSTSAWMNFMVIRSPSQHNAITGRPGIRKIRAVPSTTHGMLKFPVEGGTVTLQSSRVIPIECAMISEPSIHAPAVNQVLEEKINIAIHLEYPEQTVAIGSTLTEKGRKELCSLLKQNLDIFAWKPADMTGVPRNIAEHRLNIREGYSPVRQNKRGHTPEINKLIQEEVEKLVDTGIMKEVHITVGSSNRVHSKPPRVLRACPEKAEDAVLSLPFEMPSRNVAEAKGILLWRHRKMRFSGELMAETRESTTGAGLCSQMASTGRRIRGRYIGQGLMKKAKNWIEEELPHVLWAHSTMIKTIVTAEGKTPPTNWTLRHKAVIPAEIGMPTLRTAEMDQTKNNEALGINLDLIEEKREQAAIQEAKSKKKMEKFTIRVRGEQASCQVKWSTQINEASHAKDGGKLGPKWERPYEVKESLGKGSLQTQRPQRKWKLPGHGNLCNLKKDIVSAKIQNEDLQDGAYKTTLPKSSSVSKSSTQRKQTGRWLAYPTSSVKTKIGQKAAQGTAEVEPAQGRSAKANAQGKVQFLKSYSLQSSCSLSSLRFVRLDAESELVPATPCSCPAPNPLAIP
ncbi:hypothetical protein Tco_0890380 [Tanacetum coccineum]|uniref:Reverse transcriptase domain-containing protein n=1 Tax=Tanacetum coccineum TaxID=301880 RepID=A0ABQ5C327_9ASTR